MSSELLTLLEREAAAERDIVLAEARRQAEAILAEARRQAEELLAAQKERLEADARAALVRAQSTSQLRASALMSQAKEEAIAQVFARAEAELVRVPGDSQRYPAILRTFMEEGLRGLSRAGIVAVNPADQLLAEAFVTERGWGATVRPDPSVQGGVRVSSPEARFVVTNTLASRLERARPMLAAEVARVLWGVTVSAHA